MSSGQQNNTGLNIFILLWAAILWSCVVFVGVATFQVKGSFFSPEAFISEGPISFIYFALAASLFIAALKLPSMILKGMSIDPTMPMEELEKKFFVPFIIRIVLFESATLLGFVLTITSQKNLILPFFILSLIGFLMNIPSRNKIRLELMRGGRRV
jgi:hypothetical protein